MNNQRKENIQCKWCKKYLKRFSKKKDWKRRNLHLKCYKEIYKQVHYYNNNELKKFL